MLGSQTEAEGFVQPDRGKLLVLVHSPLVGALTWQAVGNSLKSRGWRTFVPDFAGVIDGGPPYYERLAQHAVSGLPAAERVILVGHSFAGALLPTIAAASLTPVAAEVFVDALLPTPGKSWFQTAAPEFAAQLRSLAVDGTLPPWQDWFAADAVAAILPDAALRERFMAEIRGLPLAFFEEPMPHSEDPTPSRAYLLLSQPYAPLADEVERLGWPTIRESTDHLAMLTRPELVADRLLQLLDALP
jgi:hypothetical protein